MINAPGSSIAVTMEGTRPLLVEIQGLTSHTAFGNPRRTANGVDMNRLLLIVAVLTRRAGVRMADQDIFVNVIGGLQISEPASDLAVATAIVLFGFESGAALATVVGVLIEVPVMLSVVRIVNNTKGWYEAGQRP